MLIESVDELAFVPCRAIIINVNTKLVTTLALLSALRHAKVPVLLIECQSTDGSLAHFRALMEKYQFDMLTLPLRSHGVTLDWLFRHAKSEQLLLVDSDLEILNDDIVRFFYDHIEDKAVFGCGFFNGPEWLEIPYFKQGGHTEMLYHERPWMPLVLFKVAPVLMALEAGVSFDAQHVDNEFSRVPWLARWRAKNSRLKKLLQAGPKLLRRPFYGSFPRSIYYDTGAYIFEFLRYRKFLYFNGMSAVLHERYAHHYWGVTRMTLNSDDTHGGAGPAAIIADVRQRLSAHYGESVAD